MERWSAVTYNIEGVLPLKPDTCHRVEAHDESLVVDRVPNCLRRRLSPPSQLPANNKTLRMALDGGGRLVVLDAQTHEVSPCPSLYRRGGLMPLGFRDIALVHRRDVGKGNLISSPA